jgi:hypothetical protein
VESLCHQAGLLINKDGVIRVPFLVKGELILPPDLSRDEIVKAFSEAGEGIPYLKLDCGQVIREPMIDRHSMNHTGEYLYQVFPSINPYDLIEKDAGKLAEGLYALPVSSIQEYLQRILDELNDNVEIVHRAQELSRSTSELPDVYHDSAFATLTSGLDPEVATEIIDRELSIWKIPGSQFLNGWVEMPAEVIPGLTAFLGHALSSGGGISNEDRSKVFVRAMPTRQLHITAGNAPQVPILSALRLLMTKSSGTIKAPFGATLPAALFSLAVYTATKVHPLTQKLSVVYWQGGDEAIENVLFMPGAFDRIVVWGAPAAVASVQARALFTRTISFNPRYGVSMIGQEAFGEDLDQVVMRAAADSMIYNQKACTASLVHYVEGSQDQVESYAHQLQSALARWDDLSPQFVSPSTQGQIKRLMRGKYMRAQWLINSKNGQFASGVVIMPSEFDILDHPLSRVVVIRGVAHLRQALNYLHAGVSTVGIYPEHRRIELRDLAAARGVSSILPLGHCEDFLAAGPHDGMMVLQQLVDWKVS